MPTICFVHGVGKHKPGFSKPLSDRVKEKTGATVIEHVWHHLSNPASQPEIGAMTFFRDLTMEIILDFVRSVIDFKAHSAALPEADMYVGHSAGSIIICDNSKPKVLMGSPLRLIFAEATIRSAMIGAIPRVGPKTLNIVCKQDAVASKVEMKGVEDLVISVPAYDLVSRTIPLMGHMSYWGNRSCADEIVRWYRLHF